MRFEGPDISQIVALTGFVLSVAVILGIIAELFRRSRGSRPRGSNRRYGARMMTNKTGPPPCRSEGLQVMMSRRAAPPAPARSEAVRDRPGPHSHCKWAGNCAWPILSSYVRQRLCFGGTNVTLPIRYHAYLAIDRQHMQESLERVIKSSTDHGNLQERIRASQL
jgi:hypothetical protein